MTVQTLLQRLQASRGGAFVLTAADLGIRGAQALIDAHFGGSLVVAGARPDTAALTVSGTGSVEALRDRPMQLWFSTDAEKLNVTGLLVALESPDWSVTTPFLRFAGDYLSDYPFTALAVVLSARPEDDTETEYGAGLGVYADAGETRMFLSAVLPADERDGNQTSDIALGGSFALSLGSLDVLEKLLPGPPGTYPFATVLPGSIPLASEFTLRSVRFVVNPGLEFIVTAGFEVRSAHPWVVVPGMFEFEGLDVHFGVSTPISGGSLWWAVSTTMDVGGGVQVLVGIDSRLYVDAELDGPVPMAPLLDRWAPAADLDFTVDSLDVEADFGVSPPLWGLSLDVDSGWTLFDTVGVRSLQLVIQGEGATLQTLQANGTLALGDAVLYVGGVMNPGAGWDFGGQTTYPYSVVRQPNPGFDPSAPGGGGGPMHSVTVHNDGSHFFAKVLDGVFGGAKSGLPPALDVDLQTLSVQFNTFTRDFTFNAEIDWGSDVDAVLAFSALHQEGAKGTGFQKRATGVFTVFPTSAAPLVFDLGVELSPGSRHFVAAYSNPAGTPLPLEKLVKALFPDTPATPPDGFSVSLSDAIVGYVSGDAKATVFAVDMGATLDLSGLGSIPLVGRSLSAAKTLKLAFQVVYPAVAHGTSVAAADLAALNALLPDGGPSFPADAALSALGIRTQLRIGGAAPLDFALPVTVDPDTGTLQNGSGQDFAPPGTVPTDDGIHWLTLNRTFGPLSLRRAGFRFDAGTVTVALDGGLSALGLEVDLTGLSVSSKVTGTTDFAPTFALQGLGISFAKGGVQISGAFLHSGTEYDGLATVQAEGVRLSAIGSLARVNGAPSLFIYGVLDDPLGGPPAFYVTGLAAGFGLNRRFTPPAVDAVSTFPLVADAVAPPTVPSGPPTGPFITAKLTELDRYLAPELGQYFACAGVRFTSFELLDSFVLVSASFGRDFELDLLGITTLVVPPRAGSTALAVIRLQILARFDPGEGVVMVQGQLTRDSYLMDPACRLTGGFAFGGWFGPSPYAGDFVVTLGGYNPAYQVPAQYPVVPRVGVDWQISSALSVTGGFYFALTPRAIMAGGALQALFQVSVDAGIASADVKAWFVLGADFIVYWKPFSYAADLYVDMGVDLTVHFLGTHHLSLDAGADLQVWGPPFGGHGRVHVKVIGIKIGFNVSFGAGPAAPPPLLWNSGDASRSFRPSFLPADDRIVTAAVAGGLLRKVALPAVGGVEGTAAGVTDGAGVTQTWYVVNATAFRVRTHSVIPVKTVLGDMRWADGRASLADFGANTGFGIAPMDRAAAAVNTFHRLTVTRDGQSAGGGFVLRPVLADVPGGLWAQENSGDVNAASLVTRAAIGFDIVPAAPPVPGATRPIDRARLCYTTWPMASAWTPAALPRFTATVPSPGNDPAANEALWRRIQEEIHLNAARHDMLGALGFGPSDLDIGQSFTIDSAYAPQYGELAP